MAELSGIYGADPFANMTPEEFLKMAQGQGLGKVPVSTEFPGLGSDFSDIGGIDSFFEDRAKGAYKGIDPSVLANQAEAGNALAAAELANREGEFGGLGLPLDSATAQALELPEIDMSGLDVEYQMEQAAKKKAQGEAAEAFRANEAKLAGSQGGLNSMSISESQAVTQEQADEGFLAAMDDFFESARGAGPEMPKERTIEEYKKVFSEATGIDTSGKVDKKDALMAFGLALMQNKAGKGFNVGKMLQSVGEAGDKAMPALQRAKTLAREGALAGGKYALQSQAADKATRAANQEKMMNRSSYYVYENDPEGKPYGRFDNGRTVQLNKYELNKLINDPEFDKNYSFISGSAYAEVLKEKNAIPEYGDQWDKNEKISLIGDDDGPEIFKVTGARRSSNYKGPRTGNSLQLAESPDEVYRRIMKEQDKVNLLSDQFSEAVSQIQEGVSIPSQIGSAVTMGLRNLGFNVGDGTTSIKEVKNFLVRVQATNAANILGEAGKTLSDNDRKMVANIVGNMDFNTATEEELLSKLGYVYEMVVDRSQSNIDTALDTLENEAGVMLPRSNEISQEQLKYLNEKRVASGKNPYTMEEIQNFKY
jgi:hypothetical protein